MIKSHMNAELSQGSQYLDTRLYMPETCLGKQWARMILIHWYTRLRGSSHNPSLPAPLAESPPLITPQHTYMHVKSICPCR